MKIACLIVLGSLAGCAPDIKPIPPGGQTITHGTGTIGAYLDDAGKSVADAKPHADAVGQGKLESASASIDGAKNVLPTIDTGNTDLQGKLADMTTQRDKERARADSGSQKALNWSIVVGLLLAAGGFAAFFSGIKAAQFIGIGGAFLAVGALVLTQAITSLNLLLPWFIGGICLLIIGSLVWALIKHKGSLAEVVGDILQTVHPTVPYTPTTKSLVENVAGAIAANPIPLSPITPLVSFSQPVTRASGIAQTAA